MSWLHDANWEHHQNAMDLCPEQHTDTRADMVVRYAMSDAELVHMGADPKQLEPYFPQPYLIKLYHQSLTARLKELQENAA